MAGFNLQDLMSQAKKQYETLQKKMEETVVESSSGGGSVTVKMDGRKQVLSVKIDPEAVKGGDIEMLQDLITAAINGANLFCIVAEWPAPRAEALRTLSRARAIENHAYLVVCNRVGLATDGTEFDGGSAIIAPDGTVLADADTAEDVTISAELDAKACRKLREAIGTF